jgi:hypothetical protein
MTTGPIPAIRALPERALADLALALRSGRVSERATAFELRFAVPAVGEAAAEEVVSLLRTGLALQHGALLLDAIAAERRSAPNSGVIELVTSGPDIVGATRDTGVVVRELFGTAQDRVLVVGFAVHQGREIFAALAERMQHRPDLSVRLCLDVRRAPGDMSRTDALLRRFANVLFGRNGRDRECPNCIMTLGALPPARKRGPVFTRNVSLLTAPRPLSGRQISPRPPSCGTSRWV